MPWYLVWNSAVTIICILYLMKKVSPDHADFRTVFSLTWVILVSGFIGARLFHVIIEAPAWYLDHPIQMIMIWQGGFSFSGGLMSALLGSWTYLKFTRQSFQFLKFADLFAPLASFGHAAGRVSCVIAGCCFGKTCDLPWALDGRHPTQIYSMLFEGIILLMLVRLSKVKLPRGIVFLTWLFFHSLGRFLIDSFRDDERGPLTWGYSLTGWGSLVVTVLTGILIYKMMSQKTTMKA